MQSFTPKLNNLIAKANGLYSPEKLAKMKQQEDAALTICGGLLGNCYLMAEVVENLMIDYLGKFKKEKKWFNHTLKQSLKNSKDELHKNIQSSIVDSPTNADYMRAVADSIYDQLKLDLFRLNNAVYIELGRRKIPYAKSLADIVTIEMLFQYIKMEYNDVIKYMTEIYETYYDSWYYPAKCELPAKLWKKGLDEFVEKYIQGHIDLNKVLNIKNGVSVIYQKMHSDEVTEAARAEADKWADEGDGRVYYDKACELLQINN